MNIGRKHAIPGSERILGLTATAVARVLFLSLPHAVIPTGQGKEDKVTLSGQVTGEES